MKTAKHLCFTSHKEVLMRDSHDVGVMINLIALNSWKHGIQILADCEMSTHVHLIVIGVQDEASGFVRDIRKQYTWHVNVKYGRPKHFRFGEKGFFELDIHGNSHIQTALSYVLRNPLHHGVTTTPFAYPYSSVNDIFPIEMGKLERPHLDGGRHPELRLRRDGSWRKYERGNMQIVGNELIDSRSTIAGYLPRYASWPEEWKMSKDGVFIRPCFEELRQTEMLFISPGAFQFCMFRKSDENWLQEQNLDANGLPPIKLSSIEPFSSEPAIRQYQVNEKASAFRKIAPNDFEICRIVDYDIVPAFKCHSVYELSDAQKHTARAILTHEMHISEAQAKRCVP